jgi:hypothetical protein
MFAASGNEWRSCGKVAARRIGCCALIGAMGCCGSCASLFALCWGSVRQLPSDIGIPRSSLRDAPE